MRILIIANYRTGSTTLGKWLSMELNYNLINEPFSNDISHWNHDKIEKMNRTYTKNNIICRCIYSHFKNEDEVQNLIIKFDKVILLKRENKEESAISALFANDTNNYDLNYEIEDNWIKENKERIIREVSHFEYLNLQIEKLSGLHVTYEGIYNTKTDIQRIKQYIGIVGTKYEHFLDSTNRYRNTKKNKMI